MASYQGEIFDADNHFYEAHDAFTRHVPKRMRSRCVEWVELEGGRRYQTSAARSIGPGTPRSTPSRSRASCASTSAATRVALTSAELIRSSLEPMPPEYMDRDARIARMDAQGLAGAWLFPTLGVLYEEPLKKDVDALCTTFGAFNQWLDEDWGLTYQDRIFTSPYITLADVDWACAQLEWALERDARILVMRPSAVFTRNGPRNPGHDGLRPLLGPGERGRHHGGDPHRRHAARQQRLRREEHRPPQPRARGRASPTSIAPGTSTTSSRAWSSTGSSSASPTCGSLRSRTAPNSSATCCAASTAPSSASAATSRRTRRQSSGSTSGSTPSGRTTSPRWSRTWAPTG